MNLPESIQANLLKLARFAVDLAIAAGSFYISYLIVVAGRSVLWFPGVNDKTFAFTAICAVVFFYFNIGRGAWRHVSIPDMIVLVKASALSVLAYLFAAFLVSRGQNVPRTVLLLTFAFMVLGMAAVRMGYRLAIEGSWLDIIGIRSSRGKHKVLIYGFTDQAEAYIRLNRRSTDSETSIIGIIDDERMNHTRSVQGVSVKGSLADLPRILERQQQVREPIKELIIAEHNATRQKLSELVETATAHGLRVSRLPDLTETSEVNSALPFEPKPIELGDLLGRPEVKADMTSVAKLVRDKMVLVTGAGGSIGSELCRQIALVGPACLTITDSSEFHLYLLDNELRAKHPDLNIVTRLLNVRESSRVDSLFAELKPDVVFHAAALKHVPMVEENPIEGVKTNVLGTRNVANAAMESGTSTFVVISTDKAVNPTNIMGATKRAAEAYCQSLDISSVTTRFKTVRFGNVLGSNGSVVPLFQSQIAKGGPITVTHPHIVRFFMTIPEAVRLVLHASAQGLLFETERGKIMVLDMGKPVRIVDLAERMIQLAGYKPKEIPIVFTGLRPGEKLYEELFDPSEMQDDKTKEGYFIASPRVIDSALLQRTLEGLEGAVSREDTTRAIELLSHIVPEYKPMDMNALPVEDKTPSNPGSPSIKNVTNEDWR